MSEWMAICTHGTLSDGSIMWIAEHPDLPFCMAQGATPEEALSNLDDAREDYLKDSANGGYIHKPPKKFVDTVIIRSFTL